MKEECINLADLALHKPFNAYLTRQGYSPNALLDLPLEKIRQLWEAFNAPGSCQQ